MLRFSVLENFGLRVAGISGLADGDCGFRGPDPAVAMANRKRLCAACNTDHRHLVCAQQVHGATIAWATENARGRQRGTTAGPFPETDAILTATPGLPIVIFVADCVPVFLFDAVNRVAGVVHAGREGTRARIAEMALKEMQDKCGTHPGNVHAVVGPSAGPCCYEVSPEMAAEFAAASLPANGRHLDLWKANARQLADGGVPESHITTAEICTICKPGFFSHRRKADRARNMAIMII